MTISRWPMRYEAIRNAMQRNTSQDAFCLLSSPIVFIFNFALDLALGVYLSLAILRQVHGRQSARPWVYPMIGVHSPHSLIHRFCGCRECTIDNVAHIDESLFIRSAKKLIKTQEHHARRDVHARRAVIGIAPLPFSFERKIFTPRPDDEYCQWRVCVLYLDSSWRRTCRIKYQARATDISTGPLPLRVHTNVVEKTTAYRSFW